MIQSEAVIPSAVPARPYLALGCSRLIDFCVAALVGIMVLPVLILAIIAIKLVDPGPAFYMQNRQGKDGRPFRFFKLRSMRLHSDVWLRDFLAQNPEARDPRIYRDALDPRILPVVGRFLRRYSIDELPANLERGARRHGFGGAACPTRLPLQVAQSGVSCLSFVRAPGHHRPVADRRPQQCRSSLHRNVRFEVPHALVARSRSSHSLPHGGLRFPWLWALIFLVWAKKSAGEF